MLSVFIVLTETRVMFSFSPLLVRLLSDAKESQFLIPSCCWVSPQQRPLRLTAATKITIITIKTSIRLITPKASKVSLLSAGEGVAVASDMLMLEKAAVEETASDVLAADVEMAFRVVSV